MFNFNYLKDKIDQSKFTINSISSKIDMTAQGLSAALKNETLKIRDLEKIAEVLEVDIREFFGKEKYVQNEKSQDLEKEIAHLRELLAEKERLIQILLKS
jgi:transcriptional regulator with XRE-family HTH domain